MDGKESLAKEDYDLYYSDYLVSGYCEYISFPLYVWERKRLEASND